MEKAPSLVVEILSPTSGSIDMVKKPARYGDFGIPEYWVLDPEERSDWSFDADVDLRGATEFEGPLLQLRRISE